MTRPGLLVGNLKMHLTPAETVAYAENLLPRLGDLARTREIAIAPPFTSLHAAASAFAGSGLALAAQNAHWEEEGPYTGEVSARMLQEIGCRFVIVGHSERRAHFGDTDRRVNQKVRAVLLAGMTPILCVGEHESDRVAGRTAEVIDAQVKLALSGIRLGPEQDLVVAYEPVWAIGTGRNAGASEAAEVHRRIRNELRLGYGEDFSGRTRIIYGGSVTPVNSKEILAEAEIDGALVGGASLDPESFAGICRAGR